MGAACAVVGLGVGAFVALGLRWGFFLSSTFGAFVTGYAAWRGFVGGRPAISAARGATVGAAAGLAAHLPTWWTYLPVRWLVAPATDHGSSSLLRRHGFEAVVGAMVGLPAFSVILFGAITVPAGALIGAWLARAQSRPEG